VAYFEKYGARWTTTNPIAIEQACIRKGGAWVEKSGELCGNGLAFHYKALISLLWPEWKWHRWSHLLIDEFSKNWLTSVLGPASSGKTACGAVFALADYWTFPNNTTWIVSSTTMPALEGRIWGEIKKRIKTARTRYPWLPGHVTDSKHMITTDVIDENDDIRDTRNGILCVAALQGNSYTGLANYVGRKNERFRQLADELQFMPPAFVDAIANFSKNPDFKVLGFGNPKDRTDALGKLSEPSDKEGGWDNMSYEPKTCTWNTRFADPVRGPGRAVRLDGRDSPNNDWPKGVNPFPFLITRERIESDEGNYGKDHVNVSMMNYGIMPRNSQERRVITRNMCERNLAFEDLIWDSTVPVKKIGMLDAAYSGVGGDRCPISYLLMGKEMNGGSVLAFGEDPTVIPVTDRGEEPAVQIAMFIKEYCMKRDIPPHQFFFDGTGRSSLTSALGRIWSPAIVPIEFGGKPSQRPLGKIPDCSKKYRKMVSELWFATRHLIEGRQLRKLPSSVAEEGYLRAWEVLDNGYEDVESKKDMKVRCSRSPDLYDMFVCGVEGARRMGFRIASNYVKPKPVDDFLPKWRDNQRRLIQSLELEAA